MAGKEPMLPGPDFPTGGTIINKNDIPGIMRTGKGSVKIRANYNVKKNIITITEIPYGTTVEGLLDEIGTYCDENPTVGIRDIKDQTDIHGVKIVLECETTSNPESIMQKLFSKTSLQSSFAYNLVALIDKIPTEMNLKDCCEVYVKHNIECIVREAKFDLKKAQDRLHIVDGLLKALEDIDNIIALIKKSESSTAARGALIEKYKFSEEQAKAILAMRLSNLAHLEKIELQNEQADLQKTVTELTALINSSDLQYAELKIRLHAIVEKYGDARRTQLTQVESPKASKEEIVNVEPEKCVVVMSEGGLIKRIPVTSFRTQHRNGKGVKTTNDINAAVIRTNTIDSLMIFTNQGRMYRILVDSIPSGTNTTKGVPVQSLVTMEANEAPVLIYSIYRDTDAKYVFFATKNGIVKKTSLEEYVNIKRKTGIAAITIREGDALASVNLIKDEDVVMLTKQGMAIRFNSNEVSTTSRITIGSRGIELKKDDEVVSVMTVRHNDDALAVFTGRGMGKKFPVEELPVNHRGGKGLVVYKPTSATGDVIAGTLVSDEDSILIMGNSTSICISATEIPQIGRVSLGNQLIKATDVTTVSKV